MRYPFQTLALSSLLCIGFGIRTTLAQDAATTQQDAPAAAQEHWGRGPMSPDRQLEHLSKELTLSSNQQTQIKPILESHHQQMMEMRQDQSMTREERMAKFKALDEDSHAKIAAVLDGSQKAKFDKMVEHHEGHMQRGGSGETTQPQS